MTLPISGQPGSFITSTADPVAFPVPAIPVEHAPPFHHNQGTFHAKGNVTIHYNNTNSSDEQMDYILVGIGYSQFLHTDDFLFARVPAHIVVPAHTSGSFNAAFDDDLILADEPFGKNPPRDLFCGPGEFWVGLVGGAGVGWTTNSGTLLSLTSVSATFDSVVFNYDVVEGSLSCGVFSPCPRCSGVGTVPTGVTTPPTFLCADKMTGVPPPHAWTIIGPGLNPDAHADPLGVENQGWRVNFSGCDILITAPCQDYPPELKGQSAGRYTVIVNVGGVGWISVFDLIYEGRCTPPPPPPPTTTSDAGGVDLNYWKEGYQVVQALSDGTLAVARRWHFDLDFDFSALIDSATDCAAPKLAHPT